MAESAANREDEIFLPSDIFSDEFYNKNFSKMDAEFHSELNHMDILTNQLANYALRDERDISSSNFAPMCKTETVFKLGAVGQVSNGFGFREIRSDRNKSSVLGNGGFSSTPIRHCYSNQSSHVQVDRILQARAKILQRQRYHDKNCLYPIRANEYGGVGGFVRRSGGTGVFLPRVSQTNTTERFGMRNGELGHPMKTMAVDKQERRGFHLPTEKCLPHGWIL